MANEKTPVVWDDATKKHRPLGTGEKMGGLNASSIISSQSGNLITTGSDGLAYATGSGVIDPAADNLLEATSAGKIKMDVDRLEEWLDGHPADAKAIAEAINVVSGDSGNIINEGSDKGAYMSSSQLAAAIAGLSAAQFQSLLAAFADGETIVVSGGKLVVNPANAPKAKLQAITTSIRKAGGGLAVDSDTGKLVVNFGEIVDPDAISDILDSLIDFGGGLAKNQQRYLQAGDKWVDSAGVEHTVTAAQADETPYGFPNPNYKKLIVDFSKMPDDKFQRLKDSLDMQRTLDGNINVYVDYDHSAASNTYKITDPNSGQKVIDPDRGKETKPFQTIQGAVDYVTKVYALGSYNVYIRVKPRSNSSAENYPYYKETVTLPQFTATSGAIVIRAFDYSTPPKVCSSGNADGVFVCTGGTWYLRRLDVNNTVTADGAGNHFPTCVAVSAGGTVYIGGMDLDLRFSGERDEGYYNLRVISVNSYGLLTFETLSGYQNKLSYNVGNANVLEALHLERVGSVQIPSRNIADIAGITDPLDSIYAIVCSGSSTTFANVTTQSLISYIGGASYFPRFVYSGNSPTGKRYNIQTGSGVHITRLSTDAGGVAGEAFPGDEAGTIDTGTMCWYKEGEVAAIPYSAS